MQEDSGNAPAQLSVPRAVSRAPLVAMSPDEDHKFDIRQGTLCFFTMFDVSLHKRSPRVQ